MNKEIKLVDLKPQYEEIKDELWKEWEKIFNSMHLMLGPNMKAFEKEFAEYSGVKYGIGVDSGTAALFIALKSMGINENHAVIAPSFTFFATIEAIVQTGAHPILIDIDEKDYNISPSKIKEFIEENTEFDGENLFDKKSKKTIKAIIPVHLYGTPAEMDKIKDIAKRYNLLILEDCAQAHGAEFEGEKVGSLGDAAAFSFYFSKNLSALGEAGIILTNNEEIREKASMLRVHGQKDKYTHQFIGYNSRLDEIQAVVLRLKLKKLDSWNQKRIELAEYYNERLKELPLFLPINFSHKKSVFHLYVIRTDRRDELKDFLSKNGVGTGIHYPIPSHLQPALKYLNYKKGDLPVSEKIADEILTLPMYPHLKEEDIEFIVDKIKEFFKL